MARTISGLSVRDIRTPTSRTLAGSDAMHTDPDYSATYVVLTTDARDTLEGHGMTFTLGRGNEVCVAGVRALQHLIVGSTLESIVGDMSAFWDRLVHESQLRWIGPEKGAIHLATAAIVNAVWDLYAKVERKPVWKLVADMTPEQFVACVDFRYISDALTRDEALAQGWTKFKIKVGRDSAANVHRAELVREEIGPDATMMMDANQAWDVGEAIEFMRPLARFNPLWIEEPTSPDDILGHATIRRAIAPIGVATGEHASNRVMFKQLMQAGAIDFCQFDNCRLGGLNEALAVLLLAAKFGVPVCPHAGGIGLCEYAQHVSLIDYICVSGSLENRMTEFADHLHEHFKDPVVVRGARYMVPTAPGFSIEMLPASLDAFEFPGGAEWKK